MVFGIAESVIGVAGKVPGYFPGSCSSTSQYRTGEASKPLRFRG